MQKLAQLIAAGFNHGHNGSTGLDTTVSSLEWALVNIGSSSTAVCYATCAADALETRLIASYVIQCVAHLKTGQIGPAAAAYQRARQVQKLAKSGPSCGGAHADSVESVLDDLSDMFEQRRQLNIAA